MGRRIRHQPAGHDPSRAGVRVVTGRLLLASAPASAEENGARLFAPCRACHSLDAAERGLPGPNLAGLMGRKVGGDTAFDYSPVLRKAREEGLRWDARRLDAFLADPAEMFPG